MNRKEKRYLEFVLSDCKRLEKENNLAEYGKGQKDLCLILLKENYS